MTGKPIFIIVSALLMLGLLTLGTLLFYEPPKPPLPVLGEAPAFGLTDSQDTSFTQEKLQGNVWVADFFFTTCPGPCPVMTQNMKTIHERFRNKTDLRLVNFSVNPDYDSPEILAKYAAKHRADTTRWHFLTGPEEEILKISVKGFKIGDPENVIYHSQKFVLVDRQGQIRGYYNGTDAEATQTLIGDIENLLRE